MAEGGPIHRTNEEEEGCDAVIVSNVIDGVRQSFIDSGVDVEVLEKLQQLWISKLSASTSQGLSVKDVRIPPSNRKKGSDGGFKVRVKKEGESCPTAAEPIVISSDDDPVIEIGSDTEVEDVETEDTERITKIKLKKLRPIPQVDGPADSSDDEDGVEDDEDGDDDDDDDDDDNDPDGDEEDEGVEEEPLGSEDDISDEDASDLFDTENVVVCQYDKITRARNKWKFHLKDGIMNLNGKDYVFARANGDAEW
jgi:hypothetical protein